MHMKSCDHGLPLSRNRNLTTNLFNAGHGPMSRMDNNQYDSICMSNHQPLIYILLLFIIYPLYSHYSDYYQTTNQSIIAYIPMIFPLYPHDSCSNLQCWLLVNESWVMKNSTYRNYNNKRKVI